MENLGWLAHDPDRSVVIGKVAIDIPPAKPGVMEAAEAGEGYIGYYDGGAWGIPYCSKNKEAAWLFIQWCTRKEWQPEFAELATTVVRKSAFEDPIIDELNVAMGGYYLSCRKRVIFLPDVLLYPCKHHSMSFISSGFPGQWPEKFLLKNAWIT